MSIRKESQKCSEPWPTNCTALPKDSGTCLRGCLLGSPVLDQSVGHTKTQTQLPRGPTSAVRQKHNRPEAPHLHCDDVPAAFGGLALGQAAPI